MKINLYIVSAVLLLGMFCFSCAQKEESVEPNDVDTEVQTTSAGEQDAVDMIIQPGIGVGKVHFGMSSDELKETLGKPDFIDGTGNLYVYADLGIEVIIEDEKVLRIYCVIQSKHAPEVKACKFQTAEGIGIASSESDIISAYGEPSKRSNNALMYKQLRLRFELENGHVHKILAL